MDVDINNDSLSKLNKIKELNNKITSLKKEYITCHTHLQNNFIKYRKEYNLKIIDKSNNAITDLKLLLSYLKKHNELKMVYSSYKEILKLMLHYKKKLMYYTHLSNPRLSDKDLNLLLKEQANIMSLVQNVQNAMYTLPENMFK